MNIDKEQGIIRGVNVIQTGEAEGHIDENGRQLVIDETTLEQFYNNAIRKSQGVKVKANHGNDVLSTVGFLKDFRRNGDKVLADLYLDPTDKSKDKIIWMAESIPDEFGLSAAFFGKDEVAGDKILARCSQVQSADVVDRGAVTTGLFSARINGGYHEFQAKAIPETYEQIDKESKTMEENTAVEEKAAETPAVATVEEKVDALMSRLTALEDKMNGVDPEKEELTADTPPADIKEEVTVDEMECGEEKEMEQDKGESAENVPASAAEVPIDDKKLSAIVDKTVRRTLASLGVAPVELGASTQAREPEQKNLSTKELFESKAKELGSKAAAFRWFSDNGTIEQRKELAQVAS